MKRVLILANNDVGLYKFRKELIEELIKEYKVYISLPDGDYVRNFKEIGCEFINTPISRRGTNPITDFKLMSHYKRIINKVQPDIILTYTIKPNIYGGIVCRMSRVPYIVNITGLGTAVENGGLLQKITLLLYRLSLRKSKCVFFQNEENKKFISDRVYTSNQRLIPGSGVNLEYYSLLDYPKDETINFLFVARVMKEKGIDQYLDAATVIREKYPQTRFHILGFCEQDYEDKLKELQGKGIIEYHGMQSDVRKFYKKSHCTVHPTYYPEGMSNVLLESSGCGRPIITTNRSGCREVVDDGVNGYIVEQQNSEDLINKIEKFLALTYEEKKQMGMAGRAKMKKSFSRSIVVDAYLDEIRKL
ncbi:glycosyltransferase family 4 protein [Priestia megaterium]|uniref:glycosyltransferase family 4 protein n=1 Tax=Priestia megaterium TaxID=1404 RepID=UPI000BFDEC46|nr:glycosyltransferase family 4 protein [Priestia megaterium]MCM3018697.1 glycosyltransferase family 4 protein [Priestia megaterium]PGY51860.1 glycosyltransferase family 1 protein [Priestia megaterium]